MPSSAAACEDTRRPPRRGATSSARRPGVDHGPASRCNLSRMIREVGGGALFEARASVVLVLVVVLHTSMSKLQASSIEPTRDDRRHSSVGRTGLNPQKAQPNKSTKLNTRTLSHTPHLIHEHVVTDTLSLAVSHCHSRHAAARLSRALVLVAPIQGSNNMRRRYHSLHASLTRAHSLLMRRRNAHRRAGMPARRERSTPPHGSRPNHCSGASNCAHPT